VRGAAPCGGRGAAYLQQLRCCMICGFRCLPRAHGNCTCRPRLRAGRARDRACAGQVKLLRQRFEDALGAEVAKMIDISTIDGFQVRRLQGQQVHLPRCRVLSRAPHSRMPIFHLAAVLAVRLTVQSAAI